MSATRPVTFVSLHTQTEQLKSLPFPGQMREQSVYEANKFLSETGILIVSDVHY